MIPALYFHIPLISLLFIRVLIFSEIMLFMNFSLVYFLPAPFEYKLFKDRVSVSFIAVFTSPYRMDWHTGAQRYLLTGRMRIANYHLGGSTEMKAGGMALKGQRNTCLWYFTGQHAESHGPHTENHWIIISSISKWSSMNKYSSPYLSVVSFSVVLVTRGNPRLGGRWFSIWRIVRRSTAA